MCKQNRMKRLTNDRGFTLVEMLIVLVIISVLIVLTVANLSKNKSVAEGKECEALKTVIGNQMEVYEIDIGEPAADITVLMDGGYIQSNTCSNGTIYTIQDGSVVGGETSSG
ncbi:competence type IV pilus major pilin ComGC [Aureibacillus halotolerans]|uniref:ComG operon protein 3 n=1 Tax=Aureibacillus halotolerans TaxID=1508390 RepID=A0A4V3D5Y4_9BACI|nr:competence type IV pilus major pilin ComGC [Aureibacillus halotolerans]TDQ41677.1 competence protein ComGC [Aureibacillus halotolerans]